MSNSLIILSAAVSVIWATTAPAQSTFFFDNRYAVDAPVFDGQGSGLSGTNYQAELYGSANADSLTPTTTVNLLLRVVLNFRSGADAGYVAGRPIVMVANTPAGGQAWLQMRSWDARLGATYEAVAALGIGGYGESPLFYADGGDPTLLPAGIPQPLVGLQSFSLRAVVPEPSAAALLAVGGAAIWMVRRRRRALDRENVP